MISVLIAVVLIPKHDLSRKVIFSADGHSTPLHLFDEIKAFGIQIQRRHGTHGLDLPIERAPLIKPIQLPDAQADTQGSTKEYKNGCKQPFAAEHSRQGHFRFSWLG